MGSNAAANREEPMGQEHTEGKGRSKGSFLGRERVIEPLEQLVMLAGQAWGMESLLDRPAALVIDIGATGRGGLHDLTKASRLLDEAERDAEASRPGEVPTEREGDRWEAVPGEAEGATRPLPPPTVPGEGQGSTETGPRAPWDTWGRVAGPDLVPERVTIRPYGSEELRAGGVAVITWTVMNKGSESTTSSGWTDDLYLTRDGTFRGDGTDVYLASTWAGQHAPLASMGVYTMESRVLLPADFTGDGHVVAVADRWNREREVDERNNQRGVGARIATGASVPPSTGESYGSRSLQSRPLGAAAAADLRSGLSSLADWASGLTVLGAMGQPLPRVTEPRESGSGREGRTLGELLVVSSSSGPTGLGAILTDRVYAPLDLLLQSGVSSEAIAGALGGSVGNVTTGYDAARGEYVVRFALQHSLRRDLADSQGLELDARFGIGGVGALLTASVPASVTAGVTGEFEIGLRVQDDGANPLGVRAGTLARDNFFIRSTTTMSASATVAAPDIDVGVDLGVFEAAVENGTATLQAGVSLSFNNPDGDSAGRITLAELTDVSASSIVNVIAAPSPLSIVLPLSGRLGSYSLEAGTRVAIHRGNVLDGAVVETVEATFGPISGAVASFSRITASDVASMLTQLASSITDLGRSGSFGGLVPFLKDKSYSQIIDLGGSLKAKVVDPLTDVATGQLGFSTVQGALRLMARGLGVDERTFEPRFDPATREFTISLAASGTSQLGADLGLSFDLGPVGGIRIGQGSSALTVGTQASFAATLGMVLTPLGTGAAPFSGSSLLSGLNAGRGVRGTAPVTFTNAEGVQETSEPRGTQQIRVTLRNGGRHELAITDSTTVDDVMGRLRAATRGQTGDQLLVEADAAGYRLRLRDLTEGSSSFAIQAINGSNAAIDLGLVGVDDNGDGLIEGRPLHGDDWTKRLFVQDARATASATIATPAPIDVSAAAIGFLGVSGKVSVDARATLSASLRSPRTGDSTRVTLHELATAIGSDVTTVLTGPEVGGSATATVSDIAVTGGLVALGADPRMTVSIADLSTPADVSVEYSPGAAKLARFPKLNADTVATLLQGASSFVSQLEGAEVLRRPLPLIEKSVLDLVSSVTGDQLRSFASIFTGNAAAVTGESGLTLQSLVGRMSTEFRKQTGGTTAVATVSFDGDRTVLVNLRLDASYSKQLPLHITGPELDIPGGNLIGLGGSGLLSVAAGATVDLRMGIDLEDVLNPRPFILDTSRVAVSASASAQNVRFEAAVGPVGLFVGDPRNASDAGRATLTASASLDLNDRGGDGRYWLTDLGASAVSAAIAGSASAALPLYAGLRTDPTRLMPDVAFNVPNLSIGSVSLTMPNLANWIRDVNLQTGTNAVVDGLAYFVERIDSALLNGVLNTRLPIIGSPLSWLRDGDGTNRVLEHLRGGVASLDAARRGAGQVGAAVVRQTLHAALGPNGAGVLQDIAGGGARRPDGQVTIDDIVLVESSDQVRFDLRIGGALTASANVGFDAGLSSLGLTLEATPTVSLSYRFDLSFGVSRDDGFYFETSKPDELEIMAEATLGGLNAEGRLGFLTLRARDNAAAPSRLRAAFKVDLTGENGRLPMRMLAAGSSWARPRLEGGAALNLDLMTGFGNLAQFPSLATTMRLDWPFSHALGSGAPLGDAPTLSFNDVRLELGSFLDNVVRPVMDQVNRVAGPLRPVINTLTKALPVMSDVMGRDVTLLDLARWFGNGQYESSINFVSSLSRLLKYVTPSGAGSAGQYLMLGSFTVGGSSGTSGTRADLRSLSSLRNVAIDTSRAVNTQAALDARTDGAGRLFDMYRGLAGGGFSFPIMDSPAEAFKLLLGQDATLFRYDTPRLQAGFGFSIFLPVFGPIGARFSAALEVSGQMALGFDTFGARKYIESITPTNRTGTIELLAAGFYVSDIDARGRRVPLLAVNGSITAAAELNVDLSIFRLRTGVSGGLYANIAVGLCRDVDDGDNDFAKVRLLKVRSDLSIDLAAPTLEFTGSLSAQLRAYLNARLCIGWGWAKVCWTIFDFDWEIASVTLLDFSVGCTPERTNNGVFTYDAISREMSITTTGDDDNAVVSREGGRHIVRVNGRQQELDAHVSRIVFSGGGGNDSLVVTGDVTADVVFNGGIGNDRLTHAGTGPVIARGDEDNDSLEGGSGADWLYGGGGIDTLVGGGGDDHLYGEQGNDYLRGGDGNDRAWGGDGNDTISGGAGDDELHGEADQDTISGDEGHDWLVGGDAKDTLSGGEGRDAVWGDGVAPGVSVGFNRHAPTYDEDGFVVPPAAVAGGVATTGDAARNGNDTIRGGADEEPDYLFGAGGADVIDGEAGRDYIDAGAGADSVDGGAGKDRILGGSEADVLRGGAGDDMIDGGDGNDRISGGSDVANGQVNSGRDTLRGGDGDDVIDGGDGDDVLLGEAGDDTLLGGAGDDEIRGGDEADFVDGGAGRDRVFGEAGKDRLLGGADDDVIEGGADDDVIDGGDGDDVLLGEAGHDTIDGGAGDDELHGGVGDDILRGGAGVDEVLGEEDNDTIDGGSEGDRLDGGPGRDAIWGGSGDDTLDGGDADDVLYGGDGHDTMRGGDGVDTMRGGAGGDLMHGGIGDDIMYGGNDEYGGGSGQNRMYGESGSDVIHGDDGDDSLDGGDDSDIIRGLGGNDEIFGEAGNDELFGGRGSDRLYGGPGEDLLQGDDSDLPATDDSHSLPTQDPTRGDDTLVGGSGGDAFVLDVQSRLVSADTIIGHGDNRPEVPADGSDVADVLMINGTSANDTIRIGETSDRKLNVSYATGGRTWTMQVVWRQTDGTPRIEQFAIDAGAGNDVVQFLSTSANGISPVDFSSIIARSSTEMATLIDGGFGTDVLVGGAARDLLVGGPGQDYLFGMEGSDRMWGDDAADGVDGVGGAPGDSDDYLYSGGGNDELLGQGGDDVMFAGRRVTQSGGSVGREAMLIGPEGAEALRAGSIPGIPGELFAGAGWADGQDRGLNRMAGGVGDDTLLASFGADFMHGGFDPAETNRLYDKQNQLVLSDGPAGIGDEDGGWRDHLRTLENVWYYEATDDPDRVEVVLMLEGPSAGKTSIRRNSTRETLYFTVKKNTSQPDMADGVNRTITDPQASPATRLTGFNSSGLTAFQDLGERAAPNASFDSFDVIVVDLKGGDDTLVINPNVRKSVWAFGGAGNDAMNMQANGEASLGVANRPIDFDSLRSDLSGSEQAPTQLRAALGVQNDPVSIELYARAWMTDIQNRGDVLMGGIDNDRLFGGPGADWIFGGDGDDVMFGGVDAGVSAGESIQQSNLLHGGNGNDTFQVVPSVSSLSSNSDFLDGADGFDTVTYWGFYDSQSVSDGEDRDSLRIGFRTLPGRTTNDPETGVYMVAANIPLTPSLTSDRLTSLMFAGTATGLSWRYTQFQTTGTEAFFVNTRDGNDRVEAQPGTLRGHTGSVSAWGIGRREITNGANLRLVIRGGNGVDRLFGSAGPDIIQGGGDDDYVKGFAGDDRLEGDGIAGEVAGRDLVVGDNSDAGQSQVTATSTFDDLTFLPVTPADHRRYRLMGIADAPAYSTGGAFHGVFASPSSMVLPGRRQPDGAPAGLQVISSPGTNGRYLVKSTSSNEPVVVSSLTAEAGGSSWFSFTTKGDGGGMVTGAASTEFVTGGDRERNFIRLSAPADRRTGERSLIAGVAAASLTRTSTGAFSVVASPITVKGAGTSTGDSHGLLEFDLSGLLGVPLEWVTATLRLQTTSSAAGTVQVQVANVEADMAATVGVGGDDTRTYRSVGTLNVPAATNETQQFDLSTVVRQAFEAGRTRIGIRLVGSAGGPTITLGLPGRTATSLTRLELAIDAPGVVASIYDAFGRPINTATGERLAFGATAPEYGLIDMRTLAAGRYYLKVRRDGPGDAPIPYAIEITPPSEGASWPSTARDTVAGNGAADRLVGGFGVDSVWDGDIGASSGDGSIDTLVAEADTFTPVEVQRSDRAPAAPDVRIDVVTTSADHRGKEPLSVNPDVVLVDAGIIASVRRAGIAVDAANATRAAALAQLTTLDASHSSVQSLADLRWFIGLRSLTLAGNNLPANAALQHVWEPVRTPLNTSPPAFFDSTFLDTPPLRVLSLANNPLLPASGLAGSAATAIGSSPHLRMLDLDRAAATGSIEGVAFFHDSEVIVDAEMHTSLRWLSVAGVIRAGSVTVSPGQSLEFLDLSRNAGLNISSLTQLGQVQQLVLSGSTAAAGTNFSTTIGTLEGRSPSVGVAHDGDTLAPRLNATTVVHRGQASSPNDLRTADASLRVRLSFNQPVFWTTTVPFQFRNTLGQVVPASRVDGLGTRFIDVQSPSMPEGFNSVQAIAGLTDEAGNGFAPLTRTVQIDRTGPSASMVVPAPGSVTRVPLTSIVVALQDGGVGPAATILPGHFSVSGGMVTTASPNADGTWTLGLAAALPDGPFTVGLRQDPATGTRVTDLLGNASVDGQFATASVDIRGPIGEIVNRAAIVNEHPGYVDIRWSDGSGTGINPSSIRPGNISISGVTVTSVESRGSGVYRYIHAGSLPQGLVTVQSGDSSQRVTDVAGNAAAGAIGSFTLDSVALVGRLVDPTGANVDAYSVRRDAGSIDVRWEDGSGLGVDPGTIGVDDLVFPAGTGLVIDRVQALPNGSYRYFYGPSGVGLRSQEATVVRARPGAVGDLAGNLVPDMAVGIVTLDDAGPVATLVHPLGTLRPLDPQSRFVDLLWTDPSGVVLDSSDVSFVAGGSSLAPSVVVERMEDRGGGVHRYFFTGELPATRVQVMIRSGASTTDLLGNRAAERVAGEFSIDHAAPVVRLAELLDGRVSTEGLWSVDLRVSDVGGVGVDWSSVVASSFLVNGVPVSAVEILGEEANGERTVRLRLAQQLGEGGVSVEIAGGATPQTENQSVIRDHFGNVQASRAVGSFVIDLDAPTPEVIGFAVVGADGVGRVSSDAGFIDIRWNDGNGAGVDPASINTGNVTLTGVGDQFDFDRVEMLEPGLYRYVYGDDGDRLPRGDFEVRTASGPNGVVRDRAGRRADSLQLVVRDQIDRDAPQLTGSVVRTFAGWESLVLTFSKGLNAGALIGSGAVSDVVSLVASDGRRLRLEPARFSWDAVANRLVVDLRFGGSEWTRAVAESGSWSVVVTTGVFFDAAGNRLEDPDRAADPNAPDDGLFAIDLPQLPPVQRERF
jgi:Ca2+-binding RTX toxin-like protein